MENHHFPNLPDPEAACADSSARNRHTWSVMHSLSLMVLFFVNGIPNYTHTSDRRLASLQLLPEDWHGLCALFERRKVLGTGAL